MLQTKPVTSETRLPGVAGALPFCGAAGACTAVKANHKLLL